MRVWTDTELKLIDMHSALISRYPKSRETLNNEIKNTVFRRKLFFLLDCICLSPDNFYFKYEKGKTGDRVVLGNELNGDIIWLFTEYYDGGIPMSVDRLHNWTKKEILENLSLGVCPDVAYKAIKGAKISPDLFSNGVVI